MMYTDREMTLDALDIAKMGAVEFTKAATECSNSSLRQALLQIRSQCENTQLQIGQFAQSKNFYMPAPSAHPQDIASISQFLQQSLNQPAML
jgi:spore coat protein CotF